MHNVKSDHAALIVKCCWRLATKKTKVPCCFRRDWKTLYQSQEHCAEVISHVKGSCRGANGEVNYLLFTKAIRSATTAIPALTARQRATPLAEDQDIQASRQPLVDACRALQENRSSAAARKKVEVTARSLSDLHTEKHKEAKSSAVMRHFGTRLSGT